MIDLPERTDADGFVQRFLLAQAIRYRHEGVAARDAATAVYLDPQSPLLLEATALAEGRPLGIVALVRCLFLMRRDAHLAGLRTGRVKEYAAKPCVSGVPVGLTSSGEPAWIYEPHTRRFWENRGEFWYCEYD